MTQEENWASLKLTVWLRSTLEFLSSFLYLSSTGTAGMHNHTHFYVVLGMDPGALCLAATWLYDVYIWMRVLSVLLVI